MYRRKSSLGAPVIYSRHQENDDIEQSGCCKSTSYGRCPLWNVNLILWLASSGNAFFTFKCPLKYRFVVYRIDFCQIITLIHQLGLEKRGDMSYEERCVSLHWPSLSSRRTYSSLVECYKIVFGLSHLDFEEFFQFAKVKSTRANHSYKLYCKLSRINCFEYSFFNNVISYWNNLPSNVVEAGSLELFKCKLKSFLKL